MAISLWPGVGGTLVYYKTRVSSWWDQLLNGRFQRMEAAFRKKPLTYVDLASECFQTGFTNKKQGAEATWELFYTLISSYYNH